MQGQQTPIRTQDIRTLLRARELVKRLATRGLDAAIDVARNRLVEEKSRRQYLQELLPTHVACAIPGGTETFVIQCATTQRFELQDGCLPLLWQIVSLEQKHDTQVVKVTHRNGHGQQVYWL